MESAVACCVKGRPREFDLDEALSAALRVFWRNGYDGASMAELTAEMGITKPSLYAAFGNKESLFKKALDLYEREKLAYMRTALEAATSRQVAERLLEGALALQTGSETRGCLGVISSVVVGAEAQSIRDEVIARRKSSIEALVARFTRAKQEGDLPASVKPESLARYLGAVLQGMAVQASAGATAEELRALVDTTLGLWPGR